MDTNELRDAWTQLKRKNQEIEIPEGEILRAICNGYVTVNKTERFIRNTAVFSLIILFCQQC